MVLAGRRTDAPRRGDRRDLAPLDAIRVSPEVARAFEAGPEGSTLLVFGAAPRRRRRAPARLLAATSRCRAQALVELERAPRDRRPGVAPRRRQLDAPSGHRLERAGSPSSSRSASCQRRRVARRGRSAPPRCAAISGKPPTSLSSSGRPNAERGEERRPTGRSRGRAARRGSARRKSAPSSSPSPTKRGTKRTPGGAGARSGAMSIRGMPTIHSSAPVDARATPRAARRCPCRGAAGRSTAPPARSVSHSARRSGCSRAASARCAKHAVGDHVHALGRRRRAPRSGARAPCSEWTTTASKRSYRRRWPARCPGRGSRGRTSWAVSTSGRRARAGSSGRRAAARAATGSGRRPPRARRAR